jgi:hypothetical protein
MFVHPLINTQLLDTDTFGRLSTQIDVDNYAIVSSESAHLLPKGRSALSIVVSHAEHIALQKIFGTDVDDLHVELRDVDGRYITEVWGSKEIARALNTFAPHFFVKNKVSLRKTIHSHLTGQTIRTTFDGRTVVLNYPNVGTVRLRNATEKHDEENDVKFLFGTVASDLSEHSEHSDYSEAESSVDVATVRATKRAITRKNMGIEANNVKEGSRREARNEAFRILGEATA